MKNTLLHFYVVLFITISPFLMGCADQQKSKGKSFLINNNIMEKSINKNLPTIGILIFEGVIMNEVIAPLDIFSKPTPNSEQIFNVVIIAKENQTYTSAQGLKIIPDFTIKNTPKLKVLVVPSSYNPKNQTSDKKLVAFVKEQNETTDYIASHCAGAFLIGETKIADKKKIVTYVTGGESLKKEYPNLNVVDDSKISVIQDGKFISSNGNLVSYIASLDLLEQMTSKEQREYVEKAILLDRLSKK